MSSLAGCPSLPSACLPTVQCTMVQCTVLWNNRLCQHHHHPVLLLDLLPTDADDSFIRIPHLNLRRIVLLKVTVQLRTL